MDYKDVFPDPAKALKFNKPELTKDIVRNAVVAVDADVLRKPYEVSYFTLSEMLKVFRDIDMHVTEHALREYLIGRDAGYSESLRKINSSINKSIHELKNFEPPKLEAAPIIQSLISTSEYEKSVQNFIEAKTALLEKLNSLKTDPKKLQYSDPLFDEYAKLFNGKIIEDANPIEGLEKSYLAYRLLEKSEDRKKKNDADGDYRIWCSLIFKAKQAKKDIVFVSNDKKDVRIENTEIESFPVAFEFNFFTEQHIYLLNLVDLMKLFKSDSIEKDKSENAIRELETQEREYTHYKIVTEEIFMSELSYAEKKASDHGGFVGAKHFIESILASKGFDISSSWTLFYSLVEHGKIENYKYNVDSELYPYPISAVRICRSLCKP